MVSIQETTGSDLAFAEEELHKHSSLFDLSQPCQWFVWERIAI